MKRHLALLALPLLMLSMAGCNQGPSPPSDAQAQTNAEENKKQLMRAADTDPTLKPPADGGATSSTAAPPGSSSAAAPPGMTPPGAPH